MADKNLEYFQLNRRPGDNAFCYPPEVRLPQPVTPIEINIRGGLKPKTRYKVLLDNFPGKKFEDITDFSSPIGESVRDNTHRVPSDTNLRRQRYLVSNDKGGLEFIARPFGTELLNQTDRNYSDLWTFSRDRDRFVDQGRDKIKLVEYGQVVNPESTDKVKEVKFDYGQDSTDSGTGSAPSIDSAIPPGVMVSCYVPESGKDKPTVAASIRADFYQTFYVDSKSVGGAETVDLADIDLYLRRKPKRTNNVSGRNGPGISIAVLECDSNGIPMLSNQFADGSAHASWFQTKSSPTATSGTNFKFTNPLRLDTNKFYAIAVMPEDEGYIFWYSTKGDLLIVDGTKTEKRSVGASKEIRGEYYDSKNFNSGQVSADAGNNKQDQWSPNENIELKFDVYIAEYQVNDVEITFTHEDYEFIEINNTDGNFAPGETVYKDVTAETGTVSIAAGSKKLVGVGTTFGTLLEGDKLVVSDSAENVQVFTVARDFDNAPFSDTVLFVNEYAETAFTAATFKNTVVGSVYSYDQFYGTMRIERSSVNVTQYTANNTQLFEANTSLVGVESGETANISDVVEIPVSLFLTNMNTNIPRDFDIDTAFNFAKDLGGGSYSLTDDDQIVYLNDNNTIKDKETVILSKSMEVVNASNLLNPTTDAKSSELRFNYTYKGANTKAYECPSFQLAETNMMTGRWDINNDSTNEHTNEGNAVTKHVSKTLNFDQAQGAEDIRVIMNAYRPRGTNIEVYAKIINDDDSDPVDDKYWTRLVYLEGSNEFSETEARYDYREYELTFPQFPKVDEEVDGEFTLSLDSADITTTTANVEAFSVNQVIKVRNPLFSENYGVFSISEIDANTSTITLNEPVANVNITGSGFKIETLAEENTAFRNLENDDIVRYFGKNGESYDTYNSVAIKIVLLSNDRYLTPKVDDYRVIGVSA